MIKLPPDFEGLQYTDLRELASCQEVRGARLIMQVVEKKFEQQLKDLLDDSKIAQMTDKQQNIRLGYLQALKWLRSLPERVAAVLEAVDRNVIK